MGVPTPVWTQRGVDNGCAAREGPSERGYSPYFAAKAVEVRENQVLHLRTHSGRAGVNIQAQDSFPLPPT